MTAVNVDALLSPVAENSPAGEDLDSGAELWGLERAAEEASNLAASEALSKWRAIKETATALLERSKDMRVAVLLCRALVECDGVAAFGSGLDIVRGLLIDPALVNALYPRDETALANAVEALAHEPTTLAQLRRASLLDAGPLGQLSLRDLQNTLGGEEVDATELTETLRTLDANDIESMRNVVSGLASAADEISASIDARVAKDRAPNLENLVVLVASAKRHLATCATLRNPDEAEPDLEDTPAPADAAHTAAASSEGNAVLTLRPANTDSRAQGAGFAVLSRADVGPALDAICKYYRRNEPSSPVPLLLERAKSLVHKDFMAIIEDLTPSALNDVRHYEIRSDDEKT